MKKTDIVIIGAGAVGSALARELSKYKLDVTVVEKNEDIGGDSSKSNSAIIHTGYDAKPGTLESQLVVAANPMYDKITAELDIPFKRIGALLPAFTQEQFEQLPALKHKAMMNRVYDVEYRTGEQLLKMEPNLNPEVKGGLYIPRESIIPGRTNFAPNTGRKICRKSASVIPVPPGSGSRSTDIEIHACSIVITAADVPYSPKDR